MSFDNFRTRRSVGYIALALYGASLVLPVATMSSRTEGTWYGLSLLLIGPLGLLAGQLGWFANPLMIWLIVRLCRRRRINMLGAILALFALGLTLTSLYWTVAYDDTGTFQITNHGLGFYLWIGCAALLAVSALWLRRVDGGTAIEARSA